MKGRQLICFMAVRPIKIINQSAIYFGDHPEIIIRYEPILAEELKKEFFYNVLLQFTGVLSYIYEVYPKL